MSSNQLVSKFSTWFKTTKVYEYRNAILFGVICILVFLMFYKRSTPPIAIASDNTDLMQQVKTLKDANNKAFAQIEQIVLSKQEAEKRADSLATALKIKPKMVQGVTVYTTKVDTFFSVVTSPVYLSSGDTAYKVSKHDGYVDIDAVAGKQFGTISYKSKDTVTRVEYVKKPFLNLPIFGATTTQIDLRSANPYNTIISGYSWQQEEKRTWLSIGPSVEWNPFTKRVDFGISAQLPIINFKR